MSNMVKKKRRQSISSMREAKARGSSENPLLRRRLSVTGLNTGMTSRSQLGAKVTNKGVQISQTKANDIVRQISDLKRAIADGKESGNESQQRLESLRQSLRDAYTELTSRLRDNFNAISREETLSYARQRLEELSEDAGRIRAMIDLDIDLDNVQQADINRVNNQLGLAINSANELRALYNQLPVADFQIESYKAKDPSYNWNEIRKAALKITDDNDVNGNQLKQQKFDLRLSTLMDTVQKKGFIAMDNSHHGATDSAFVIREVVARSPKPGVIYFEAPYALNLHPNKAEAMGAWITESGASFPKALAEVFKEAEAKGWDIVATDALKVSNGSLDKDSLMESGVPQLDRRNRKLNSLMGNPARQNYIARNINASWQSRKNPNTGGLVSIGKMHLVRNKGGDLGRMLTGTVKQKNVETKPFTPTVDSVGFQSYTEQEMAQSTLSYH